MTYVDIILEEVKHVTPEHGFNVCVFDDFEVVGEKLTIVGHFDSRAEAQKLSDEYDEDTTVYIYGGEEAEETVRTEPSVPKNHSIPAYIKKAEDDYKRGIVSDNDEYEKLNYGKETGTSDGAIKGWLTRKRGGGDIDKEMQGGLTIGDDGGAISKGSGYDDWKARQDSKPQISPEEKEKKRKEWWAKRDKERERSLVKSEIGSTVKPVELRPSGGNYRIEAKKAMLQDRIESETKFVDKYVAQQGVDEGSPNIKGLRNKIDILKNKLKKITVNDDSKLPHIPMGSNTHTRSTKGYIHGKTIIKVQSAVTSNPATDLLNDRLKSVWNNMPDEHRNLVKTLNVKTSKAGYGRGGKAGSFNHKTNELIMNISTIKTANVVSTIYHEIGHAKWYDAKANNPEKVKKFVEGFNRVGRAPTKYSESYRDAERRNTRSESNYRRKMKRGGFTITQESEDIMESNRIRSQDLYQNETHSELNSYAMGTLPKDRIVVGGETLSKLLDVYKEMYDLE